MTLIMTPVLEKGHDPREVGAWTLDQLSWWYLIRVRKAKLAHDRAEADAAEARSK